MKFWPIHTAMKFKPLPSFGINSKILKPAYTCSPLPHESFKWLLDHSTSQGCNCLVKSPGIIDEMSLLLSNLINQNSFQTNMASFFDSPPNQDAKPHVNYPQFHFFLVPQTFLMDLKIKWSFFLLIWKWLFYLKKYQFCVINNTCQYNCKVYIFHVHKF